MHRCRAGASLLTSVAGSQKCDRCKGLNKPCIAASGMLKVRGAELTRLIKVSDNVRSDEVAAASVMASDAEKVAALERKERLIQIGERIGVALEKTGFSLQAFLESFQQVNAPALAPSEKDYGEDEEMGGGVE
ncbi:hypothetical protein F4804DRAFT_338468 [Jackrogersella minutella]|nr:hypothetical protein F4804DRAFT_338468 [Jackrogersella minutella]